ncbi:hypothetical protein ACINK0_15450 [Deinococcus sp. VB343]|uniref:hypothetical protein n=1 Tax=Deinococcus sp. VB343 TaxID=3385567 RepID=UPI0039C9878D
MTRKPREEGLYRVRVSISGTWIPPGRVRPLGLKCASFCRIVKLRRQSERYLFSQRQHLFGIEHPFEPHDPFALSIRGGYFFASLIEYDAFWTIFTQLPRWEKNIPFCKKFANAPVTRGDFSTTFCNSLFS